MIEPVNANNSYIFLYINAGKWLKSSIRIFLKHLKLDVSTPQAKNRNATSYFAILFLPKFSISYLNLILLMFVF